MFFRFFHRLNSTIFSFFLKISWILVALMTCFILVQVFFRYVLNDALSWPEEAARALMIWMTALVAAPAYRNGNFTAIDLLSARLPSAISKAIHLFILLVSLIALVVLSKYAFDFFLRGFRTRAASFELKLAWIYLAMPVCFGSMALANLELIFSLFQKTPKNLSK